jgi:hypothetical protein
MASVRRMPELPRQGMGCGCTARPRPHKGAGIAFLSDLVRPMKEMDEFTRREFQTGAVSRCGRRANDEIRPTRSKAYLDDPEGKDRNPQPCRTPRWTEVGGKRLPGVVRRSTLQLCRMLVRLASRPRTPLSGPHSLRATRMNSVIDAAAAIISRFHQCSSRNSPRNSYSRCPSARRIAIITDAFVTTSRVEAEAFWGATYQCQQSHSLMMTEIS